LARVMPVRDAAQDGGLEPITLEHERRDWRLIRIEYWPTQIVVLRQVTVPSPP
jgi:hypothetical protein